MSQPVLTVVAMLLLAAGTLAFRFAGPVLRSRVTFPPAVVKLLEAASIVLLAALVATSGLTEGHHFAGVARPTGVLVAAVLAWYKVPFAVVVLAAALVAAGLRLLGVP